VLDEPKVEDEVAEFLKDRGGWPLLSQLGRDRKGEAGQGLDRPHAACADPATGCAPCIGGIACIAQSIALILGARDFSPGHEMTPRCLRKHERIEATEITQYFLAD
jgi:hypothetical protein